MTRIGVLFAKTHQTRGVSYAQKKSRCQQIAQAKLPKGEVGNAAFQDAGAKKTAEVNDFRCPKDHRQKSSFRPIGCPKGKAVQSAFPKE